MATTKYDKIINVAQNNIKKYPKGFMGTLNLYSRIFTDFYTKGKYDVPEKLEEGKFYYSTNRIFTMHGVKKMFFITDFPSFVNRGIISDLRLALTRAMLDFNKIEGGNDDWATLSLVMDGKAFPLDFGDRKIKGKWRFFVQEYQKVKAKAQDKTLEDELYNDKYSEGVQRKVNSFLAIKEAKETGASFYKTVFILELCASSNDALNKAETVLKTFLNDEDVRIKTKDVFIQTNEYNKAFTPMNANKTTLLNQMYTGDVVSDDNIVSLTVPTHGVVGDKVGVYHGIDIQSRNVVAIDFTKVKDARNVLITAQAGQGKSNYAKMLYTFYSAMKDQYSVIIIDYEGIDYVNLGNVTGAKQVSFSGSSGSYVNTMVIGDITGDDDIDASLWTEAIEATERVFNLLTDPENGMSPNEKMLFNTALMEVYEDFGVYEKDPTTWKNSRGTTFYNIYAKLEKMIDRNDIRSKVRDEEISNFVNSLMQFFASNGMHKHWFKRPVSVQELKDSQNIIFNFGMAGTSEGNINTTSLALRQLFVGYLVNMLASKNRVEGIFTVVFFEEMQRYLEQQYSSEIVAGVASGGRKLGIIAYYITNSPKALITNYGEDARITKHISTLLSNIKTHIIGALQSEDMLDLIVRFDLQPVAKELMDLADVVSGSADALKYCFMIHYKNQYTIVRMLSHPDLDELPLYTTDVTSRKSEMFNEDVTLQVGRGVTEEDLDRLVRRDTERARSGRSSFTSRVEDSKSSATKNIWGTDAQQYNTTSYKGTSVSDRQKESKKTDTTDGGE